MLTLAHQLNTQQLSELDVLCVECKKADGNIVALYNHLLSQNRPAPGNLLYHQDDQLIGFLSTFFFYEDACEIAVMVAPAFRKQGIAIKMLNEALPLIQAQEIKTLIFSTPNGLNNEWLPAQGFCYQNSEYQMQRQQNEPIVITNNELVMRPANQADLPALCAIDNACFPSQQPDMAMRFHHLLYDPNYKLFVAEKEGVPVGKVHLHWQPENARLTDIAILPDFQGQGLGSEMLGHCINYCLAAKQSNINLDVETTNQQALGLYTRLGFIVKNAYDFWTIPIDTYNTTYNK